MKSGFKKISAVFLALAMLSGCSSTKYAREFNGVSTPDGTPVAHVSTSNVALHLLLGKKPLAGNASLEQTVSDFTNAAQAKGATKVRIVQSSQRNWWFVFFPFSLLFTPVTSNVAGDALK